VTLASKLELGAVHTLLLVVAFVMIMAVPLVMILALLLAIAAACGNVE
jgi:hypothetical protein